MNSVRLRLCVLVLLFECGLSNSSCDDIFAFFTDGENEFGQINLKPVEVVSELLLRVNFTVQSRLGEDFFGRIDSTDNALLKYNRGQTIQYRVYFPVISPRPKVTAISLNGVDICTGPGDISRPNQVLTSASLGKRLFYAVGDGPPPYKRFSNEPQKTTATPLYIPIPPSTVYNPHFNSDDEKYINAFVLERFGNPSSQAAVSSSVTQQPITARPTTTTITQQPITARPTTTTVTQQPITTRPTTTTTSEPDQRVPDTTTTTTECGVAAGGNGLSALISNGQIYERGDVPWLVAIYTISNKRLSFACGGTLVSDRHVVTAAHCRYRRVNTPLTDIVVKVGVNELDNWDDDIAIIAKPIAADKPNSYDYVNTMLKDDIMILTLNKRVKFGAFIRPACLWSGNTELNQVVGATGVVAGWGGANKHNSVQLDKPQLVRVPIISTQECRASNSIFHQFTSNKTFCAGSRNGAGPCAGDSGGGLYLLDGGKWKLRGIVSLSIQSQLGEPCNLNEYIVYTDIAQYLPWIKSILTRNNFD